MRTYNTWIPLPATTTALLRIKQIRTCLSCMYPDWKEQQHCFTISFRISNDKYTMEHPSFTPVLSLGFYSCYLIMELESLQPPKPLPATTTALWCIKQVRPCLSLRRLYPVRPLTPPHSSPKTFSKWEEDNGPHPADVLNMCTWPRGIGALPASILLARRAERPVSIDYMPTLLSVA